MYPGVRYVDFCGNMFIDDSISEYLINVETLDISYCKKLTNNFFTNLTSLRALIMVGCD